jgi:pyrroloquinoline quinone (PQQ) biosynthesis protein C
MSRTDTVPLPRKDAIALAGLLRMLETVLEMTDVSVADALDEHFGFASAVDLLFATAGLHADTLHALLAAPTEHSQKAETTR